MRRLLLVILLMPVMTPTLAGEVKQPQQPQWTEQQIWTAICEDVGGDPKARHAYCTEAQYRQCNRILKGDVFTDEDRFNKDRAYKVFIIYTRNCLELHKKKWTLELAVRFWYGGRAGDKGGYSVRDWERVRARLEKLSAPPAEKTAKPNAGPKPDTSAKSDTSAAPDTPAKQKDKPADNSKAGTEFDPNDLPQMNP